jgi:hypothetical protein
MEAIESRRNSITENEVAFQNLELSQVKGSEIQSNQIKRTRFKSIDQDILCEIACVEKKEKKNEMRRRRGQNKGKSMKREPCPGVERIGLFDLVRYSPVCFLI